MNCVTIVYQSYDRKNRSIADVESTKKSGAAFHCQFRDLVVVPGLSATIPPGGLRADRFACTTDIQKRTLPSLLAAVETLIHTALPWHCPWLKRCLRDFIVAILVGQTVVIRTLAATLQSIDPAASAASHERRLRRMTEDNQLNWTISARILPWVVRFDRGVRVTIILDETSHTGRWSVLTAALSYHGRAIPLAWMIWRGQTTRETGYWEATQTLLKQVRTIIPRTTPVVVVADRAFGCPIFIDQVVAFGWDVVVRVHGQSRVRSPHVSEQPIHDLAARGSTQSFAGEVFKGAGWRSLTSRPGIPAVVNRCCS